MSPTELNILFLIFQITNLGTRFGLGYCFACVGFCWFVGLFLENLLFESKEYFIDTFAFRSVSYRHFFHFSWDLVLLCHFGCRRLWLFAWIFQILLLRPDGDFLKSAFLTFVSSIFASLWHLFIFQFSYLPSSRDGSDSCISPFFNLNSIYVHKACFHVFFLLDLFIKASGDRQIEGSLKLYVQIGC